MTAMYIVEVRRDALAQPMGEMRAWLDAHRIDLKVFKTTIGTNYVAFRLEFQSASEAADFAHAFDGQVLREDASRFA
jgi:hypothetical protein